MLPVPPGLVDDHHPQAEDGQLAGGQRAGGTPADDRYLGNQGGHGVPGSG